MPVLRSNTSNQGFKAKPGATTSSRALQEGGMVPDTVIDYREFTKLHASLRKLTHAQSHMNNNYAHAQTIHTHTQT